MLIKQCLSFLVFGIFSISSFAKTYCDYTVRDGETLESISLQLLAINKKNKAYNELYSRKGLIEKLKEINSLESVNRIFISQVIKVPCMETVKEFKNVKNSASEFKDKFSLNTQIEIEQKFINTFDKVNSSTGNVFIFARIASDNELRYLFKKDISFGLQLKVAYGFIDQSNGNRLNKTKNLYEIFSFFTEVIMGNKLFHIGYGRNETISLKAQNETSITLDEYDLYEVILKYKYRLMKKKSIGGILRFASDFTGSNSELDLRLKGTVFYTEYLRKGRFSLTPLFSYEYLESTYEKQDNFSAAINIGLLL